MGNRCRIVAPDESLAMAGEALVHDLDERWSRFRETSEICALNRCAGRLAVVSPATYELVARAEHARMITDGWFNPLQLARLETLGYVTSWDAGAPDDTDLTGISDEPANSEEIDLIPAISAVRLPPGTRFDPGGIGKGLAGDLVADHLLQLGATSVQIELGGDVRVAGAPWSDDDMLWVSVQGLGDGAECARLTLAGGGVATSGIDRRAWRRGERSLHHLIDPRSGWPAETDLNGVTVAAESLWYAEVMAKTVLMAGSRRGTSFLRENGLAAVLHRRDGDVARVEVVSNMEVRA